MEKWKILSMWRLCCANIKQYVHSAVNPLYIGSSGGHPCQYTYSKIWFIRCVYCITHYIIKNIRRKCRIVLERAERKNSPRQAIVCHMHTCSWWYWKLDQMTSRYISIIRYRRNSPIAIKSDIYISNKKRVYCKWIEKLKKGLWKIGFPRDHLQSLIIGRNMSLTVKRGLRNNLSYQRCHKDESYELVLCKQAKWRRYVEWHTRKLKVLSFEHLCKWSDRMNEQKYTKVVWPCWGCDDWRVCKME